MTTVADCWLAADPAVPLRDILLDPLTAPVPLDAAGVDVVRCKYRVGESLRVLYRCATSDGDRLVTVRATAGRPLRWWMFPDDRRLPGIDALLAPSPAMAAMAGGCGWVRSEVAEYAPERSITVRAVDADGHAIAYVKQYAAGERDVGVLAARYAEVSHALGSGVPRPISWSTAPDVLLLEAVPGRRLADMPPAAAAPMAAAMGQAIAALHGVCLPAGTPPFGRLGSGRVERATDVLAAARPDVASAARDLARRIAATRVGCDPVLLHGDCHPKNAIADGHRLALIDLDQGGSGAAAADIGSLLARVRVGTLSGVHDAPTGARVTDAFLAGYASQRQLPPEASIRWHTAASLVVEQAVRAVNRVRADVLAHLPDVLAAADDLLPAELVVRRRVLMHCQHSLGLGHLVRSLALAGGLAEHTDVTLLNGGRLPPGAVVPRGVDLVDLPSLGHDDAHQLVSQEPGRTVEELQAARRRTVLDVFHRLRPDLVVIELYPFGRRKFEFELLPLLDAAAASSPRPLIVSSVRDILVTRHDQARHDERVVELANRYLDAVLVHSDPSFSTLEESFRPCMPLTVPVHYTGFVVATRPPAGNDVVDPLRRVLVSAGGGMVGEELLTVAAEAAPAMLARTGLATTLVAGPFLPDAARQALRSRGGGHTTVVDRVDDLCGEIQRSVVSVSQAGYNTTMDLLVAGRPAVVVPFEAPGEDEQTRRAARMDELGLVRMLPPCELSPGRLVSIVERTVTEPPPAADLDLAGRERSSALLAGLLAARRRTVR